MNRAFKTVNGMKVRLDLQYCLRFLRSEDEVSAWSVAIEAFSSFAGFLSLLGAIVLMFFDLDPWSMGFAVLFLYLFGFIVSQSYRLMSIFVLIYGLVFMVYESLMRFFIPHIALLVVTIVTKQYLLLLAYLIARILGFLLVITFIGWRGKSYVSRYGVYMGDTELTAIKLLKYYSDERIDEEKWMVDYGRFVRENSTH